MQFQNPKILLYLLCILLGFILGNIFGIFLKFPVLQIFLLILISSFELLHFISYQFIFNFSKKLIFLLYFLLRGFLLGIFVEAFKVGS